MDQNRFDDLTRALATTTTRRQFLKTLAGATAGGLLAFLGIGEARADPPGCKRSGKNCKENQQCCSGICNNGTCVSCLPTGTEFPFNCGPGCCDSAACCSRTIESTGIFCTCVPPF